MEGVGHSKFGYDTRQKTLGQRSLHSPSWPRFQDCNVNKLTGSTGTEKVLDEPVRGGFRFVTSAPIEAAAARLSPRECADGRAGMNAEGSPC